MGYPGNSNFLFIALAMNHVTSLPQYKHVALNCVFLPGLQDFAEQYVSCNPSSEQGAVDAILILAFAIVMLNTDLHSPNVKRRMTEMEFINNLQGR